MKPRDSDRIFGMTVCALLGFFVVTIELSLGVITMFPLLIWAFGILLAVGKLFEELKFI